MESPQQLHYLFNSLPMLITKKTTTLRVTDPLSGDHGWPSDSPYKESVLRKVFDVITVSTLKEHEIKDITKNHAFMIGISEYCRSVNWTHWLHRQVAELRKDRPVKWIIIVSLTHWGRDKMAAIFQTIFSNAFSWMKMYGFRLKIHWSLFLSVHLTISQHWFR